MAQSIQLPQGIAELVKADGRPREITGIIYEGATPTGTGQYMVYLDDGVVRSVPLADWPAAQAELAQKEADRQQAAQVKQQILGALQGLTGRRADGVFTNAEIKALVMAWVHTRGGLNKAGEFRAPGEWL
jgi:hypothetical protein